MTKRMSRRSVLKAGAGIGALGLGAPVNPSTKGLLSQLVNQAHAASTSVPARLDDIEHVVIVMQENHSFDQYFGTYRGVRGFSDPNVLRQPGRTNKPIWYQYGWGPGDKKAEPNDYLLPFHLDMSDPSGDAACVDSPSHAWGPQHQGWNGGAMDQFVAAHIGSDGEAVGPHTMGYYTRADIPFYYDLADAFTLCDGYHCSVMSDTTPNRLYVVSATLDPDGLGGGPVLGNPSGLLPFDPNVFGGVAFTWKTMPEALEEAGISWKAYQPPGSQIDNAISYNVLMNFKNFQDPLSPLFLKGVLPSFPGDFQLDVATDSLPAVSWIMSMGVIDEHPPSPIVLGDLAVTEQILATLLANPAVWEKTVLIVTYDENGGFFDHVVPPTAPPGTPGEWLTATPTVSNDSGDDGKPLLGPVGLGFRVPTLVISPFSAGGLVCTDTLDHTSILRFIETRFGVPVPNLSEWRRSVTGDMTEALNLAAGTPGLPEWVTALGADVKALAGIQLVPKSVDIVDEGCVTDITADEGLPLGTVPSYPIPANQSLPSQEPGTAAQPSGVV
jgi:phospholipase C